MEEKLQRLSDREREVVPLICEGFSNKQVAMKLNISIKTVAHHRAQVLKKTAARNTADMVRLVTRANSFGDMTFTRHQ
jgi:FixJ family two-component response regulator